MAPPALAETRQHGNVIFDIPAGWAKGAVCDDGSLSLYSDLPNDECEFCDIYIATSAPRSVLPEAWLNGQAWPLCRYGRISGAHD